VIGSSKAKQKWRKLSSTYLAEATKQHGVVRLATPKGSILIRFEWRPNMEKIFFLVTPTLGNLLPLGAEG
jgi:hypothetical protein